MHAVTFIRHVALAGGLMLAGVTLAQTQPVLSGSFTQLNAQLAGLGVDGWVTELSHMHAIGMDTLIVQYARYGGVSYFPTSETVTEPADPLPPTESIGRLVWHAPRGSTTARHVRVTVAPDSREWTMISEVRIVSAGENVAAGLGYTLDPAPAGNYLDPDAATGGKLTDGLSNFAWSDMVGWQHPGEAIVIDFDLGAVSTVEAIEIDFMRSDISNVDLPAHVEVSVSGDGSHFLPVGEAARWGDATDTRGSVSADSIGDLLTAAERVGFDVWLGLGLDPAFWQGQFDAAGSVTDNTTLMLHLESLYGSSPALVGYYLPEEIDDRSFVAPEKHAAMIEYLSAMSDAAHEIGRPVMVAPFFGMNPDAEAYAAWWDVTLESVDIDVIALQDGVGTRRTSAREGVPVFRALKEVTDRHGVALWSDLEVFEQIHGWPVDDRAWQARPARIDTVLEQLELEAPYVEKFVVFDFTHYMSPRLGGMAAELYEDYATYRMERTP